VEVEMEADAEDAEMDHGGQAEAEEFQDSSEES
jgi:hypothetical protein